MIRTSTCNGRRSWSTRVMDLRLTPIGDSVRLTPVSVVGMLWLQTHFEACTWDLVCSGTLRISRESCDQLQRDASSAGLMVQRLAPATT